MEGKIENWRKSTVKYWKPNNYIVRVFPAFKTVWRPPPASFVPPQPGRLISLNWQRHPNLSETTWWTRSGGVKLPAVRWSILDTRREHRGVWGRQKTQASNSRKFKMYSDWTSLVHVQARTMCSQSNTINNQAVRLSCCLVALFVSPGQTFFLRFSVAFGG